MHLLKVKKLSNVQVFGYDCKCMTPAGNWLICAIELSIYNGLLAKQVPAGEGYRLGYLAFKLPIQP